MSEALRPPTSRGCCAKRSRPVEPPADLAGAWRTLQSITEMAADELEAWELSAMRDPRNWVRPAAALVVGGAPARRVALGRCCAPGIAADSSAAAPAAVRHVAERTMRDLGRETRKLLGER